MKSLTGIAVFLTALLSGCVGNVPTVEVYTLTQQEAKTAPKATVCSSSSKVLRIISTSPLTGYSGKEIIYSDSNGTLNHYLYSLWNDAPVVLLENLFQQQLQRQPLFKAVVTDNSVSKADYLLESHLLDFKQIFVDKQHSNAWVNIQFNLLDAQKRHLIASIVLHRSEPIVQQNARSTVQALNQASQTVAMSLAQWLIQVIPPADCARKP